MEYIKEICTLYLEGPESRSSHYTVSARIRTLYLRWVSDALWVLHGYNDTLKLSTHNENRYVKAEEVCCSERSVHFRRTTCCYISEDRALRKEFKLCRSPLRVLYHLTLIPPFFLQKFSSTSCLSESSICVLPSGWEITFHTHRKQRVKLSFCI
jgi:hypothetical protein